MTVAWIDRNAFKRLLGPLEELLERNKDKYAKYMSGDNEEPTAANTTPEDLALKNKWNLYKLRHLKNEFDNLDKDNSGYISKAELKEKKNDLDQI